MSVGLFKIATVLFLAALPLGLFGALNRGEAPVGDRATATASSVVPKTGGREETQPELGSASEGSKPLVGNRLAGRGLPRTCTDTAPRTDVQLFPGTWPTQSLTGACEE